MTSLVAFMNTQLGRGLRVVLGMVLIYAGLTLIGGTAGAVVAVIGLVPIVMGIWGHCLLEAVAPKAHRA